MGVFVVSAKEVSDLDLDQARREILEMRLKITRSQRYRTIAGIFAKHGLLHLLEDRGFFRLFFKKRTREEEEKLRRFGRRLRMVFEELGPTFIKLGQVLVSRQEIIPEPVTTELSELLNEVPPMPFRYMAAVMEDGLPEGLKEFEWIDPEPVGSASLAQVYRAQLKDGRVCAVKVVRPVVDKLFETDISIIQKFAGRLQKRLPPPYAASVDLNGLVRDYYSSSTNELDMLAEARTMREHREMMKDFETISVPEVYKVSKNVLVMEYVDGWNLKEFPVDFLTFEERFMRMVDLAHYYVKTFSEGYYHGDPHGSNIMIDKHTKKAYVIDWGMVGRVDSLHTEAIFRMLLHTRLNQAEDAAEAVLDIIQPTPYTDPVRLKDQLRSHFVHYVNSDQAGKYNWGNLLIQAIVIGVKNHCRIPNAMALWAKGFTAAEGTARWLCPEISYHTVVESADVQILKSWLSRRFNYRANASWISEVAKLAGTLPRRLNKILERLAWNDWKVVVENRVHEHLVRQVNKMVNRLALAWLASGLFLGSAVFLAFGNEWIQSVPSLKWLMQGMLWGASALSVYLLWRVFRSKRA
jgi:ubiquinone biosynthesis protein